MTSRDGRSARGCLLVVAASGAVVVLVYALMSSTLMFSAVPPDPTWSRNPTSYPTLYPSSAPSATNIDPSTAPSGSTDGSSQPSTTNDPTSSPTPNQDEEIAAFIRDCEQATTFREAQLVFPEYKRIHVGHSESYSAAVDIRSDPAPADKTIDDPHPRSEPIKVQCVLSARLVPLGEGIEVVPDTDADGAGWRLLKFTPNAVVEWSWTVKPIYPVDQRLRLELMPAVMILATGQSSAINSSASYITDVYVEATQIEKLSHWFNTQWKLLATVAAALGVAFLGLLAFSSQVREAITKLFKPKQGATQNADDGDGDGDQEKESGATPDENRGQP